MRRVIDEQETVRQPTPPRSPEPTAPSDGSRALPDEGGRASVVPISARDARVATSLGRYRLLCPIARGGMGAVYAAELPGEAGVSKLFAVKVLRDSGASAADIEGFVQEARVTLSIEHPNVVTTYELGMEAGEPFLVMELVRGVPLSKVLERLRARVEALPADLAAWIAAQVATALAAAHELRGPDGALLGVVHRDVSPQNILLGWDGRVLLVDFGVAKLFESARATESGVIKGKFGYMSPEQLNMVPLDGRSDVFALGVVLCEMLKGRPLYSDLPPAAAMLRISSDELPNLDELPDELGAIVRRALARDREARFASATALRDALRAFRERRTERPDELDLARLLGSLFPDGAARFEGKLRAAREASPASTSAFQALSTTSPAGPAASPRSRRGLLIATSFLASAALVIGVAAWSRASSAKGRGPAALVDTPSAALSAPTPSPSQAPSVSSGTSSPLPSSPPSGLAMPPSGSEPRAASPVGSGAPVKPALSASAVSATSSGAAPAPSVKGQPFRTW